MGVGRRGSGPSSLSSTARPPSCLPCPLQPGAIGICRAASGQGPARLIGGTGELVGLVRFNVANGSVISVAIDAVGTSSEPP